MPLASSQDSRRGVEGHANRAIWALAGTKACRLNVQPGHEAGDAAITSTQSIDASPKHKTRRRHAPTYGLAGIKPGRREYPIVREVM